MLLPLSNASNKEVYDAILEVFDDYKVELDMDIDPRGIRFNGI